MSPTRSSEGTTSTGSTTETPAASPSSGTWWCGSILSHLVWMLFILLAVTGGLLMTVYAPATTTAWGSVHHIQTQVPFGWLIRGLHRFGSDAMIIVLVVYLIQMLVTRAYRQSPRSRWSIALCVLGLAAALAHTGYLLPWDQQAYWGTKVRTNIVALVPLIGPALRRALLGGTDMGQASLTRFYALHVLALPLLFVWLLAGKPGQFLWSRSELHGEREPRPPTADREAPALGGAITFTSLLILLVAVSWSAHYMPDAAFLTAPADPAASDYPARPEWYALFLYQWLKYFDGRVAEVIAAIIVPSFVMMALLSVPWWDRLVKPRTAHIAAMAFVLAMFATIGVLTGTAVTADRQPSGDQIAAVRRKQSLNADLSPDDRRILRAWDFNRLRERARRTAERAIELTVRDGLPPAGPLELLADDPPTRGPQLFAQHCATCHRFSGHDGLGVLPEEPAQASDLAGFGSRTWIRGLLTNPMDERYFGLMRKPDGTPAHTRMEKWTSEQREGLDEEARVALDMDFDAVAAYLEEESLHPGRAAHPIADDADSDRFNADPDAAVADDPQIARGRQVFLNECNECHSYGGERFGTFHAPEMLGYGSIGWIEKMITDPDHESRYRNKGREPAQMPPFRERLTPHETSLIARWLHNSRASDNRNTPIRP